MEKYFRGTRRDIQFRWLEIEEIYAASTILKLNYLNYLKWNRSSSYLERLRRVSFKMVDEHRYLDRARDRNYSHFQPSKLEVSGLDFRRWFRNIWAERRNMWQFYQGKVANLDAAVKYLNFFLQSAQSLFHNCNTIVLWNFCESLWNILRHFQSTSSNFHSKPNRHIINDASFANGDITRVGTFQFVLWLP